MADEEERESVMIKIVGRGGAGRAGGESTEDI